MKGIMNKMNGMKRMLCAAFAMVFILTAAMPVLAAPKITQTDYEGRGRVEVDFGSKVNYKNVKVTVKDSAGKTYTTRIVEKDNDDLTFDIQKYAEGKTYTYTITGIKKRSESEYGKVTGTVKIPAKSALPQVKKVEYDRKDKEVEFDFNTKVEWKGANVKIKNGSKNYVVKILSKDNDEIDVKVKGLQPGTKYTYTISGVRTRGSKDYKTVTGTFVAR